MKGGNQLTAQIAETGKNAANKGIDLSGISTISLFGARPGQLASDGGSATTCSVLTQAIIDTSKDAEKLGQNAILFFNEVTEVVRTKYNGHAVVATEGNPKFNR